MSPPDKPLDRPERRHPEHEDTNPPRPIVGGVRIPPLRVPRGPVVPRISDEELAHQQGSRRNSLPEPELPHPPRGEQRAAWFMAWSPGTIAGAAVTVIVALGGATGLRELLGSGEATRAAIAASEVKILKQLAEQTATDRASRDAISASLSIERERVEAVANLACALNDGQAHSTWPCELRLKPPAPGNSSPLWATSKPWPSLPNR